MNRAWLSSLSGFWESPNLPMWLTIAALGFFAVILLVTLFRAERSVANGALTVITMLAIGIAVTTMLRASGGSSSTSDLRPAAQVASSLPALSCLDGLAGESVETACEKSLFASADSAAAAVSYAAAQITRLASFGSVAAANKAMTPELNSLRRAIERDRYGLISHVLMAREGCTLTSCPFFQSLTNTAQIGSNMNDRFYEGIIAHYAPAWSAPPATASIPGIAAVAPATPNTPPGRPVSGDFPSAASIPPVNIMTPEPTAQGSAQRPAQSATQGSAPAPSVPQAAENAARAPVAAKKAAAPKSRAQAPTSLAPTAAEEEN